MGNFRADAHPSLGQLDRIFAEHNAHIDSKIEDARARFDTTDAIKHQIIELNGENEPITKPALEMLDITAETKQEIKNALISAGYAPGNRFADYPSMIRGGNYNLVINSVELEVSSSYSIACAYNEEVGILDENYFCWDLIQWNLRFKANGYSKEGLTKPIGIWMNVNGGRVGILWQNVKSIYDCTGTAASAGLSHCMYGYTELTSQTQGQYFPANLNIAHGTAGAYNSDRYESVIYSDGSMGLYAENTKRVFVVPDHNNTKPTTAWVRNNHDITDRLIAYTEFYRDLSAICSGVATTAENGVVREIQILNASGSQPTVNEDMYFWVEGDDGTFVNTGLMAKYNLNSNLSTPSAAKYQLTTAIRDAIYNKQKQNGVNMNDTGVNSNTKPILCDGAKGAEAVAVDGYLYITTPIVSQPNQSQFTTSNNIIDSPAAYYVRHFECDLANCWDLLGYYQYQKTLVAGIVNYLRTWELQNEDVPTYANSECWAAPRSSPYSSNSWCVSMVYGSVSSTSAGYRYLVLPVRALYN